MSKRFYLSPSDIGEKRAILRGKEAHHVIHVMRMRAGQTLDLFDGEGHQYEGRIQTVEKGEVSLSLSPFQDLSQPAVAITVACALPKQGRIEAIIEKLTEVGVEAIIPVTTERTVSKIARGAEEKKRDRWERIAISAAKQCGAPRLPKISNPLPLSEVLPRAKEYALAVVFAPGHRSVREFLDRKKADRVIALIGPEGGWSEEELSEARRCGWELLSLGKQILKVETATVAAAVTLHYALDP